MIITSHSVDLSTPTGPMRTKVYRPQMAGRYPAILFYSEIFQLTTPIERAASVLAGHGYLVLVPEVFHELNLIGTVLSYDDEGKEKGNNDKWAKPLEHHDSDVVAMLDYLATYPEHNGYVASMGVCIGGHLAYRAALNPAVKAACCLYATDLHSNTLPAEEGRNTLQLSAMIDAELMMIWGKQDPHVPPEGRERIYRAMTDADVTFTWHEFNAQHAFMRDEGDRYDPELAIQVYRMAVDLFSRTERCAS